MQLIHFDPLKTREMRRTLIFRVRGSTGRDSDISGSGPPFLSMLTTGIALDLAVAGKGSAMTGTRFSHGFRHSQQHQQETNKQSRGCAGRAERGEVAIPGNTAARRRNDTREISLIRVSGGPLQLQHLPNGSSVSEACQE